MSEALSVPPACLPTVSADVHFARLRGLKRIEIDPQGCAQLFAELGALPTEISRLHIHLRPDYELGYTKAERRALAAVDPNYDEAASTTRESDGTILINIAYGSGFEPVALLLHEAEHAMRELKGDRVEPSVAMSAEQWRAAHFLGVAGSILAGVGSTPLTGPVGGVLLTGVVYVAQWYLINAIESAVSGADSRMTAKQEEKAEELAADKLMQNKTLRAKYKEAIQVKRK